ncbi:MAG: inositol-3-phosphate synthase [Betaproteobacteria bacterium]
MAPSAEQIGSSVHAGSDKIGVLLGGLGAISTTLIAGVEAIKKGLAPPVGSLALLGTLNTGTEEAPQHVRIREHLDLPGPDELDRLVFGGWDIVDTDAYSAARVAGALETDLLDSLAHELSTIRPWPGIFDPRFNRRRDVTFVKSGRDFLDLAQQVRNDIEQFQRAHAIERVVLLWCGSTEVYLEPAPAHETLAQFEAAMRQSDHAVIAPSMIYAYAALSMGIPFVNATPSRTVDIPALGELARREGAPLAGKDLKTGQTLLKTILAPGLRDRMLGLRGWYSTNILGNGDGATLDDPEAFRTKQESKLSVLTSILHPELYPELYGRLHHQVRINYYPPRGDNKESWDAIDIFGWLGYPMSIKIDFLCRDSILAAPLLLDLALFMDLAKRARLSGPQEWLSFYFKSPMCANGHSPEHELSLQLTALKQALRGLASTRVAAL